MTNCISEDTESQSGWDCRWFGSCSRIDVLVLFLGQPLVGAWNGFQDPVVQEKMPNSSYQQYMV